MSALWSHRFSRSRQSARAASLGSRFTVRPGCCISFQCSGVSARSIAVMLPQVSHSPMSAEYGDRLQTNGLDLASLRHVILPRVFLDHAPGVVLRHPRAARVARLLLRPFGVARLRCRLDSWARVRLAWLRIHWQIQSTTRLPNGFKSAMLSVTGSWQTSNAPALQAGPCGSVTRRLHHFFSAKRSCGCKDGAATHSFGFPTSSRHQDHVAVNRRVAGADETDGLGHAPLQIGVRFEL